MAEFDYTALDSFGESQEGRLEAENLLEASKILKERKWIVKSLDESRSEISLVSYINPANYLLTSRDLEVSFAQLSTLISSGVNLLSALKTMSIISVKETSRNLWKNVHQQVQTGKSLSESLSSNSKLNKSLLINLIEIGEETGELDRILMTVSYGMERKRAIRGKIMGALLYPVFVLIISLVATAIAVFVLIPQLEKLIKAMGKQLHPLTQLLLDIAEAVQKYSIPSFFVLILVLVLLTVTFINKKGRLFLDRRILKLPVIGSMFRVYYSAEFARNFALLIRSGVKLTDSLQHCAESIWNTYLKSILKKARNNVINGSPLTETLSSRYAFSPLLLSMVSVGEKTGSIDNLLEEQSKYHFEILDKYINRLSGVISFFMVVLVAGTIGFVFAAILLTYFA